MLVGACVDFEIITADVTQYTKLETCPHHQCQTASGRYIDANDTDVIACPRRFKLGSRVIIDGKEYICEDRTARWVDNLGRFDIWAGDDYNGAIKWGVQRKIIIIYENLDNN